MPALSRREFLKLSALAPAAFLPHWNRLHLRQASAQQPNILLVFFDAFSTSNISLYGYPRRTTPNLERLAQRATVYHRHHSAGKFTPSSTASLLSGIYPSEHRVLQLNSRLNEQDAGRSLLHAMQPTHYTLTYTHNNLVEIFFDQLSGDIDQWTKTEALCLASLNYAEHYLTPDYYAANQAEILSLWQVGAPSGSFFLQPVLELRRRLLEKNLNRKYATQFPRGLPNATVTFFTLETAMDWIASQAKSLPQPYLGYIHLLPPHAPYTTRAEFVDAFKDDYHSPAKPRHPFAENDEGGLEEQHRLYDEAILYCDAEFARLFDRLEQSGALDNTILILSSDHGEMFERGILGHENPALYEPVLHIPLLVWQPGQATRQDIYALTNTVDLFPTLLRLAGQSIPEYLPGLPLPGLAGAPEMPERCLFSVEGKKSSRVGPLNKATLAAYQGDYKLIQYRGYNKLRKAVELYNLKEDPEELNNLAQARPNEVEQLKQLIRRHIDRETGS